MPLLLEDRQPTELESAPDEPVSQYANIRHGYTIAVPVGWTESDAAASADGTNFESRARNADLRVFGSAKAGDADFRRAVEALRGGTANFFGGMIGQDEYCASATDRQGYRIQFRLIRMPGKLISARMRYPAQYAAELDPVAAVTLNSLTLAP